jgi:hypothetical protein
MKHYNTNVSREEVAALLNYDPQTGLFTHKVSGHKRKAGAVTGRLDTKGYVRVRLLGYEFKAHRLAWLLTYGTWPAAEIDHINGCPSDNRIMNLRDVSVAENGWNRIKAMRNNKTGILGVCEMSGKFVAQIGVGGRRVRLGAYDTVEEAASAYNAAKAIHHTID